MTIIDDALTTLLDAIREVEGIGRLNDRRDHLDLGATLPLPSFYCSPPALAWGAQCSPDQGPTEATFLVHLLVQADARATEKLLELVLTVTAAINDTTGHVVTTAAPGTYPMGGVDMPCYEITVEADL